MKKLFLFAAAAAMFAACSETEVLDQTANQQAIENQGGVKFDVYAQRGITRGGGQTGDLTNKNIGYNGFGVFAYYTAGEQYNDAAKPNFMYNQQVTLKGSTKANPGEAAVGSTWVYEPVKYWPNEYGNAAISDEIDYVTFFSYAPYTKIVPETGEIDVTDMTTEQKDSAQNYNIISVNKNNATGDPIVKYIVDTNPATSVDLLWGVAAETADRAYSPIDGGEGSQKANKEVKVTAGLPFLNLVKPNDPQYDRIMFNLKHALAKVRFTIDYIDDAYTPDTVVGTGYPKTKTAIDTAQTRIFVRAFQITGWATQGALNLNNTEPGLPLWLDFDGVKELTFGDLKFFDGRSDAKEGTVNGGVKNEKPLGLNPDIIENYGSEAGGGWNDQKNPGVAAKTIKKKADGTWEGIVAKATTKTITDRTINGRDGKAYSGTVLLFGGDPTVNDGYFYVIPDDSNDQVDCEITYDVETVDTALNATISDGLTKGISVENVIKKEDILNGLGFKAGYQYDIHIHLGMTSVKIEAAVTPWKETEPAEVDLPDNQDPQAEFYWKDANGVIYTVDPTDMNMASERIMVVKDETSWNNAWYNGALKAYYAWLDTTYPLNADGTSPNPSSYDKSTLDWDDNDPRHHSYTAWKANPGITDPWEIVFDLDPNFSGTMHVEYDGAACGTSNPNITAPDGFGADGTMTITGRRYIIASAKDFGLTNSSTFDINKLKVTLTPTGVKKYYTSTNEEVGGSSTPNP